MPSTDYSDSSRENFSRRTKNFQVGLRNWKLLVFVAISGIFSLGCIGGMFNKMKNGEGEVNAQSSGVVQGQPVWFTAFNVPEGLTPVVESDVAAVYLIDKDNFQRLGISMAKPDFNASVFDYQVTSPSGNLVIHNEYERVTDGTKNVLQIKDSKENKILATLTATNPPGKIIAIQFKQDETAGTTIRACVLNHYN
ncbi:MAG: hypothetical protein ABIH86_07645 [Planctomycetota bacterium]